MKIAIIGGGITGLTAGYELTKRGHRVTIFEKEKTLGGLAGGFKKKGWSWHLESAYHHLFTNDDAILSLMKELGLEDTLMLTRPVTANLVPPPVIASEAKQSHVSNKQEIATPSERSRDDNGTILPLDSPLRLLTYPALSFTAKIRTTTLLAFLKLNPFWQPLESVTAEKLIRTIGGNEAWKKLWEPLLIAKFGTYARSVAASWFWARIKKRTPKLYYIEGGFHTLIAALTQAIKKNGGTIRTGVTIHEINKHNWKLEIGNWKFDKVLLTIPTPVAAKLVPHLSFVIGHLPFQIPHLHAQTLIVETKEPILKDTYWLNIMDRSFPFLAVVAHTNMIDKKHYGNRHITYIANYLPDGHRYLSMSADDLYREFLPFIKRLNPSCHVSRITCHVFVGPFAQPVHELHYSRRAPTLETAIPGVYLANLDSIYPWDRGTNYAVELGQKAAKKIINAGRFLCL